MIYNRCHYKRHTKAQRPSHVWIVLLFMPFAMMLLLITPAFAKDKKTTPPVEEIKEEIKEEEPEDTAIRYAPDFCDFEITFPEAPYTSKRCPQNTGKCYDLTGYTMVYDLKTTVEVSVTCAPSSPADYSRYNDRVIKAALNGMVSRANITEFEINTNEQDDVRQGSLIGTSTYGKQGRIYNAQLWIGQNSVMTIEAKLTGPKDNEADASFGDILASIQVKKETTKTAD